jgi:hypothetical protein
MGEQGLDRLRLRARRPGDPVTFPDNQSRIPHASLQHLPIDHRSIMPDNTRTRHRSADQHPGLSTRASALRPQHQGLQTPLFLVHYASALPISTSIPIINSVRAREVR